LNLLLSPLSRNDVLIDEDVDRRKNINKWERMVDVEFPH